MDDKLFGNKVYAALFILLGVASVFIGKDGTFFVFSLMVGIPLFFARKDWVTNEEVEDEVCAKKER